jgi:hypothetical protein
LNYFLAICKDRPSDPDGFYYTVYFVNNSDYDIEELSYETGGFATFDEELVQTSTFSRVIGKVPTKSFVEVETDDEGSFDFVIHFTFLLKHNSQRVENKSFTVGKYFSGAVKPLSPLPTLNKPGYLIKE